MSHIFKHILFASALLSLSVIRDTQAADISLLNVSYDPTRELYKEYNEVFSKYWKTKTGNTLTIKQSHGGGGKQTRAVLEGLEADVVTFALSADIDQLHEQRQLLPQNWQTLLPNNSSPYTSTIVFLVRKGNPKNIKDWDDLAKEGTSVITPSPKTSGGARWNYLAAWAYGLKHNNNNDDAAREFVSKIYKNTTVLDTGARGSTTTFAEREIGDVLITWENEAHLVLHEFGDEKYQIVTPTYSILAEPPVAVVSEIAKKHNTTDVATEYLKHLYTKEGQEIIAKNFYRPIDKDIATKYAKDFPKIELATIKDFGGWTVAQKKHFADNGIFDEIIAANATSVK